MTKLSHIGRIFYGVSMAALGVLTIYYRDFPYMLIPERHTWVTTHPAIIYVSATLLILAGAGVVFQKGITPAALLLGSMLLLIFCFYFVPYQVLISPNNLHWGDWENAEKELAISGGAFVIAGCFYRENGHGIFKVPRWLMPLGTVVFSLTIICFSIDHFLYAKEAAGYIPSWVPAHLFWMYFAGAALLCAGLAIILRIRVGLFASLLALMIFLWVLMLHIPKSLAASPADRGGEITSAFLALAYCGIAGVIAGARPADHNR